MQSTILGPNFLFLDFGIRTLARHPYTLKYYTLDIYLFYNLYGLFFDFL